MEGTTDLVAMALSGRRPNFLGCDPVGIPAKAGVILGRGPAAASSFASRYEGAPGYSATRPLHVVEEGHGYGK